MAQSDNNEARLADSEADLGFEQQLWKAAAALRDNMGAAECSRLGIPL